jgi:hypothetical protein
MIMSSHAFTISLITCLFFHGSPLAVTGFVVAVVIYTFYSMFWCRWFSHVGIEVFKFVPAFADFNAATTIINIGFMLWVFTSCFHVLPTAIATRLILPVRLPEIMFIATAGFAVFILKITRLNCCFLSTKTRALIHYFASRRVFYSFQNCQSSKLIARQISKLFKSFQAYTTTGRRLSRTQITSIYDFLGTTITFAIIAHKIMRISWRKFQYTPLAEFSTRKVFKFTHTHNPYLIGLFT